MRLLLTQTSSSLKDMTPAVPYSQLILAAHVEDVADVKITGQASDGTFPTNDQIMAQIEEYQPEVVGMTIEFALGTFPSMELARRIKEYNPEITVIAGGHQATFAHAEFLDTGAFDAIFAGEGEISLREYVQTGDVATVPGVIYKKGDDIVRTEHAPLVNLNDMKPPAYHLLPTGLKLMMGIESSRGCPFDCNYCETRNFWGEGRLRKMSAENFVRNFKYAVDNGGGSQFFLVDDCFTADMRGHVEPICEAMIAEGLSDDVAIMAQCRVDNLVRRLDYIPMLGKAGFKTIALGIESIYEQTLKAMNKKGYDRDDIRTLIQACKDNGIKTIGSLIFGYPHETPEMILETADFLVDIGIDAVSLPIATPLPGSNLYKMAKKNDEIISTDYDRYDYLHRLWTAVPEHTEEYVATARRRFFLRPDYIEEAWKGVYTAAEITMPTLMVAGILNREVGNPRLSRPRTSEEWWRLLEGFRRVLANHYTPASTDYGAVVKFVVDDAPVYLTIEGGMLTSVDIDAKAHDLVVETTGEPAGRLWGWCNLDILSAYLLGKAGSPGATLAQTQDFIEWFTETQAFLRWQPGMQQQVPVARSRINDWIAADGPRSARFGEILGGMDGTLFIGNDDGGVALYFGDGAKVAGVTMGRTSPEDTNFAIDASSEEVTRIFGGDTEVLYRLLGTGEVQTKKAQSGALVEPRSFFDGLPAKFLVDKAAGVDIVLQYEITHDDETVERWWLTIQEGALSVGEGVAPKDKNLGLEIGIKSFQELISGRRTPMELFSNKEIVFDGSPFLMLPDSQCFDNLLGR